MYLRFRKIACRNFIFKLRCLNHRKVKIISLAFFIFVIVGIIIYINFSLSVQQFNPLRSKQYRVEPLKLNPTYVPKTETFLSPNESEIWLDFCNITDLNPWDSSIMKFIQPEKDHLQDCKPKISLITKLVDGQLLIFSKEKCQMRCLFPKGDWLLDYGNWNEIINGTKPECDIVEVECRRSNEKDPFYKYLHSQVYRPSSLPIQPTPKSQNKFDVHLIIFDSVGESQFIRSMPKTIHMLREYYEAITFRHLNKIGINSHPNGFAFLLGKMYDVIPKSPFSRGHVGDYSSRDIACKTPLDKEQFIGFRFKDDGYVTMMAEDWASGVLMWPNCEGFQKTPMDHYIKPFQLRLDHGKYKSEDLHKIIHENSCRDHHYDIFEYLKSFLHAYSDMPKFSITWISYLTHDYQNALSSTDDYFYQFFNETKENFENSFVFFMGDHGLRYGEVRETNIGEREDNNPFFFLSVPKRLRAALIPQLRTNAKELITHYDIYATLNDISQPTNPRIPKPLIRGNSLFHPLPQPRTCETLKIPFEFCICRSKKTLLPNPNKIAIPASKLMVDQINYELYHLNYTRDICSELSLDESAQIVVEDYGGEQIQRVYKVSFLTVPGNGKFWGIVSFNPENEEFRIISTKFSRLDSYGSQSKCASTSDLASYCFCLDQTNSTPKPA